MAEVKAQCFVPSDNSHINIHPAPSRPLRVLGFGIPLNRASNSDRCIRYRDINLGENWNFTFKNAIEDWEGVPLTLRERTMLAVMGELTDKPDWKRKLNDEAIVEKWRREALEHGNRRKGGFSDAMFDYCLKELQEYASFDDEHKFVEAISATATVYKSDDIVPESLRQQLITAAAPLENVPESEKDWHPGSDKQVLDLVHPSLCPLLYGRSRILTEGVVAPMEDCAFFTGKGVAMPRPSEDEALACQHGVLLSNDWGDGDRPRDGFYSRNYQWLPCDVSFRENGDVKIESYINNLHPQKHKDLYHVIEKLIACAVPMWGATLAGSDQRNRLNRINARDAEFVGQRPEGWGEKEWRMEMARYRSSPEPEGDDEPLGSYAIEELNYRWGAANNAEFIPPEPREYGNTRFSYDPNYCSPHQSSDLRQHFKKDGLQVIVKLANIHLTPEKPEYKGGSWHIEGQLNEHIVATALYYYDSDNITDNRLAFRELTDFVHLEYEQYRYRHVEEFYDIEEEGPKIQELGDVLTRQGRLLTFPNVLQHRVQPFKLQDATCPGHRKIVALFLVDPHLRIPSTMNVPPQQRDWWHEMVLGLERVAALPAELIDWTVDSAGDCLIDTEEAKEIRARLMEERGKFVQEVDQRFIDSAGFTFCEH